MTKVYTYAKFKIQPGKATEFKALAARCVEIVREREPDTLFYEWFLNDAETECVALDCYADLDAIVRHVENIGPLMRQIMAISERYLEIYGNDPSERFGGRTTAKTSEFFARHFIGKPPRA